MCAMPSQSRASSAAQLTRNHSRAEATEVGGCIAGASGGSALAGGGDTGQDRRQKPPRRRAVLEEGRLWAHMVRRRSPSAQTGFSNLLGSETGPRTLCRGYAATDEPICWIQTVELGLSCHAC